MIPYGRQEITNEDIAAVVEALKAPLITQGPAIDAFEQALAERVGARFAVAFNSGTAALHAAYFAAGIGPGRSVAAPPITFVATTNAAYYLGGRAVFVDVDPVSILLDPTELEKVRDPDIRVVTPVHFTGHVADLERIGVLAQQRGWVVVEDAAHALGASYRTADGQEYRVGACAHSAMCCFSFHPVKHVTTGEGGAVTTNDPALYSKLRRFRTHGITRETAELTRDEGPWYYEQHDLGFNYRLTDIQCALGTSQLRRLGPNLDRRRAVARTYDAAFAAVPGVETVPSPGHSTSAFHLYVIRVPGTKRRAIFQTLRDRGIGVNVHYIPVHTQPWYRKHGFDSVSCPVAEAFYASAISLPMYHSITDRDVETVIKTVIGCLKEI
jgi:perosamine synthetase